LTSNDPLEAPEVRRPRRILVAGGAGFIGRVMCRRLLGRGDSVVCVDNLITGRLANIAELDGHPSFRFVDADVCLPLPDMGQFDAVINLACPASPVDFGPLARQILDVGSRGTANLIDLAVAQGARFVQASTSEVYGDPERHPQAESYYGNVNPIGPRAVYDESKRFAEALVASEDRRRGANTLIVRIFNTYGPGMRIDDGRVVSEFVRRALAGEPLPVHGDGSQTRSLCFVEDLVTGLIDLLDSAARGPVNLGSDDEWSMAALAGLIVELCASSSDIVFLDKRSDDPERRRPDLALARRLIGWDPKTDLRAGLAATISWARAEGAVQPGGAMQAGAGER
jgi:dTDP-glucose 4,6-dehydratase